MASVKSGEHKLDDTTTAAIDVAIKAISAALTTSKSRTQDSLAFQKACESIRLQTDVLEKMCLYQAHA